MLKLLGHAVVYASVVALMYSTGFLYFVWDQDLSGISIGIILAIPLMIASHATNMQFSKSSAKRERLWFYADALTTVGLIGTIVGFLLTLGPAFRELDLESFESMKDTIQYIALGTSTSLLTTLFGITGSLFTKHMIKTT